MPHAKWKMSYTLVKKKKIKYHMLHRLFPPRLLPNHPTIHQLFFSVGTKWIRRHFWESYGENGKKKGIVDILIFCRYYWYSSLCLVDFCGVSHSDFGISLLIWRYQECIAILMGLMARWLNCSGHWQQPSLILQIIWS